MLKLGLHPIIRTIAEEVIDGQWGDGNIRYQNLTQAGFNYGRVQAEVNRQVEKANEEYVIELRRRHDK